MSKQPDDTKVVEDDQHKGKYALYFRGKTRTRKLTKAKAEKLAKERIEYLRG